jgi:hypothetical protein
MFYCESEVPGIPVKLSVKSRQWHFVIVVEKKNSRWMKTLLISDVRITSAVQFVQWNL